MSDGQDKSDDLIAELAKLMANSAEGAEPEAKPGPKLVSSPEPTPEPRPAAPTIRIPGMDAPVAAKPPAAAPTVSVTPNAEKPAAPAPTIRIPGMDQPVAAPRPVALPAATPPVSAEARPVEARSVEVRAPSIDFGALPPAATIRPEPLANWQDREIPKPVAARPSAAAEPVLTSPVPAPKPAPVAVTPPPVSAALPVPTPVQLDQPEEVARPDAPVVPGKPAPEGDSFDFDFGFGSNPPTPIEAQPRPSASTRPATAPAPSSDDPIADLIAAELDAADQEAPPPAPVPARPPVQQPPVIRSFPAAPPAQPQQQRAVTTNPVRPPTPPAAQAPSMPVAETDRFATAPVFGVGGKPAAAPAPVERDPMDEIESLIGEAVRVELSAPEKPAPVERPKPTAAPVVPPLTTGFAPRRAALKDTEPQLASAEAAILAAAAASGADVGRVDGQHAAEAPGPYKRPRAKAEKPSLLSVGMRQYVGIGVAAVLLLAAGFGLYWVLGMGRTNDAEAPVLTADATPVKEVPPAAPPKEDAQGSVVFNELGGGSATPPANEQLVSRDDSTETSVADVAQTVGDDGAADSESELANRKVRTVTVRPDGSIVSGEDAVAGSEALPVDRPNVPVVPGADVQPSELLAALPDNSAPAATDPLGSAINAASAEATTGPAPNVNPSIVAPVPMARPANRSTLNGGSAPRVAAADPNAPLDLTAGAASAAAPAQAPVASTGGAYVQLSSQPTSGDAQASLQTTQNRLSGILNGRSLEIRQVDLGARGVWYRVVLPVNSFSEATQTCASFKANGTDCVPING
ncbi:MAG: hypothetical protein ACTHLT_01440 [Devosia sp.]